MDLISRQAAIDELSYCQTFLYDSMDKYPKIELGDAKAVLEALPAAEPRKGRWVEVYLEDGILASRCTACGELDTGVPLNYCPNCGARMGE